MSSGRWKIDDYELGNADVTVHATAHRYETNARNASKDTFDSEITRRTGNSLERANITFSIISSDGDARSAVVKFIRGLLLNRSVWRLEAGGLTENTSVRLLDDFTVVLCETDGNVSAVTVNHAQVNLTVPVVILGAPFDVGGTGSDKLGGYVEMVENDFFAASDTPGSEMTVMLALPEQLPGFPKLRSNTAPFSLVSLGEPKWLLVASTVDGNQGLVEIYDIADYTFNLPHSAGDGGPFNDE